MPTLPLDHDCLAIHSTISKPSGPSLGWKKSNTPPEQPVPRTLSPTSA
jgi:hypothetical protein